VERTGGPATAPKDGTAFSNTLTKFLEKLFLHGDSDSTIWRRDFFCSALKSARSATLPERHPTRLRHA